MLELAIELANQVALNSPAAVARSKQGLWYSLGRRREDAEEFAWALARLQMKHPDFTEGTRAFAEKRSPQWAPPE